MEHYYTKDNTDINFSSTAAPSRAANFGDGIFETMVYAHKKVRFASQHQQRVNKSLELLKIDQEGVSTLSELNSWLDKHFKDFPVLRIRWNIYRSGEGKYTPQQMGANETLMISDYQTPQIIKEVGGFSADIFMHPSPWANCKTLNALPYVMANIEKQERGLDEIILKDKSGFVSEAGSSNIFWVKNDQFFTPSLKTSCIAGISRAIIIQRLKNAQLTISEGEFYPEALLEADQVFTSNVTGVSYLKQVENKTFLTKSIPVIDDLFSFSG